MASKNTRIAYLKRMLRRLDGEDARMQQLVSTGDLSAEGAGLSLNLIEKSRQELRSELQELESKADAERAQSGVSE